MLDNVDGCEWRDAPDCYGYEVNQCGEMRRKGGRVLSPDTSRGQPRYTLSIAGKRVKVRGRAVAESAFGYALQFDSSPDSAASNLGPKSPERNDPGFTPPPPEIAPSGGRPNAFWEDVRRDEGLRSEFYAPVALYPRPHLPPDPDAPLAPALMPLDRENMRARHRAGEDLCDIAALYGLDPEMCWQMIDIDQDTYDWYFALVA